jgi:hypothetical protein
MGVRRNSTRNILQHTDNGDGYPKKEGKSVARRIQEMAGYTPDMYSKGGMVIDG